MPKKIELVKESGVWDTATATEAKKSVKFAGRTWTPDRNIAFVVAEMCHSLPLVNAKRRCLSAATIANSYQTSHLQLADFHHRLRLYGAEEDAICGTIAAMEFPDKEDAIKAAKDGKAVPLKVLIACFRKATGVQDMLKELADEIWKVSMECDYAMSQSALWDGEKFYPYTELGSDMKELIQKSTVLDWEGKRMSHALGGEDGNVMFSGVAFTPFPADPKADIKSVAASHAPIEINAGWKSPEDWRRAVASAEPTATQVAAIIIGKTDPAPDGHVHEILKDLTLMPAQGHSHYMKILEINLDQLELEGVTSGSGEYKDGRYQEHVHTFKLKGATKKTSRASVLAEDAPMDRKGEIKFLRENAKACEKDNPALAKTMNERADALDKEGKDEDVESVIAERIKAGDLIPKAKHVEAVDTARKEERASIEKEAAAKVEAEKAKAESTKSRLEQVTAAKLDPKFVLGKDRTIETVVSSIPSGADGDKQFAERLEEWATIAKNTGQGVLLASTGGKVAPKVVLTGGGSGNSEEKPKVARFV